MSKIKIGSKVKLTAKALKEFKGYEFYKEIIKFKTLTVNYIKSSGGLQFSEIDLGVNMFGVEKGLRQHWVTVVPKGRLKKSTSKIKNKKALIKKRSNKITHYIAGQNNKRETTTACGLSAGKDGIIHVLEKQATCKKCKLYGKLKKPN